MRAKNAAEGIFRGYLIFYLTWPHRPRTRHPRRPGRGGQLPGPAVGVEQADLRAIDQLGRRDLLKTLGLGPSLRAAAIGSIIARPAQPGSERAARRRLRDRSAPGELPGVTFDTLGPMRLSRASHALMAHREASARRSCNSVSDRRL